MVVERVGMDSLSPKPDTPKACSILKKPKLWTKIPVPPLMGAVVVGIMISVSHIFNHDLSLVRLGATKHVISPLRSHGI